MTRVNDMYVPHTAQGMLCEEKPAACGASCGTSDKPEETKPAACGASCGAGDK